MNLMFSEAQLQAWLGLFWLPFVRVSAAFLTVPLFSSVHIPSMIKILVAVFVTLALAPVIAAPAAFNPLGLDGLLLAANELLIGLTLGLILQLVIEAVTFAGQLVATGMGLSFATLVDPQQGSVTVLSQFFILLMLLLFLSFNGHLDFLRLLAESFRRWPVGSGMVGRDGLEVMLLGYADLMRMALRLALPALMALILAQLAIGVVSRSAPSLNLFSIGLPLTLLLGLFVVDQILPTFASSWQLMQDAAFQRMGEFLGSRHG